MCAKGVDAISIKDDTSISKLFTSRAEAGHLGQGKLQSLRLHIYWRANLKRFSALKVSLLWTEL